MPVGLGDTMIPELSSDGDAEDRAVPVPVEVAGVETLREVLGVVTIMELLVKVETPIKEETIGVVDLVPVVADDVPRVAEGLVPFSKILDNRVARLWNTELLVAPEVGTPELGILELLEILEVIMGDRDADGIPKEDDTELLDTGEEIAGDTVCEARPEVDGAEPFVTSEVPVSED